MTYRSHLAVAFSDKKKINADQYLWIYRLCFLIWGVTGLFPNGTISMCFLQRSSDLLRLSSCRTRDGQVNCRHLVVIWTKDNYTSLIVSVGEWNSGRTVNDGRGAFVSPDSGHFSHACENLAMAGTKNAPRHLDWLGSISGDDVKCGTSLFVAPRGFIYSFCIFLPSIKTWTLNYSYDQESKKRRANLLKGLCEILRSLYFIYHAEYPTSIFVYLYSALFYRLEPGLVEVSLVLKYTPDVDEESVLKLRSREDSSTDEETRGIKHTKSAKDSLVDGVINLCSPVQVCIMPKALRWKRTGWITTFES